MGRIRDSRKSNEHFTFLNANPKGYTTESDCLIRATAVTLGISWGKVIAEQCSIALVTSRSPYGDKVTEAVMNNHGYVKMPQPRKADNTYYTVTEFCKYLKKHKYTENILVGVPNHMTALARTPKGDYRIFDTWDCGECTVRSWYTKDKGVADA